MENKNDSSNMNGDDGNTNNGECPDATMEWEKEICDESVLQALDEPFEIVLNESRLRIDEKFCGFDNNVGDTWIYPINLPIRNYQFSITKVALFKNTLVVLPTGLGKTFIAAVVMYNIYRWYPTGKVVFMAPTRPLVNQQIEACRKIMGMPVADLAEMTGKQNKKVRCELWHSKRIFFATPQVVQSDINDSEQNFPFSDIKLLVIDEAHKAKGRYAYTEVVQSIIARNSYFRVLALSATPGRRIEDVAEIIKNLLISHIELRSENSVDVISYTHKKSVKTVVVPLGEELARVKQDFIEIIDPYVRNLMDNGVLSGSVNSLSRGWLIMEQKKFREMSIRHKHPNQSVISTDFSICISLYHALELLERHGLRVFLNYFDDNSETSNEKKNEKFFVALNPKLRKFLDDLRKIAGPNPFLVSNQTMTNGQIMEMPSNLDFGHPKFEMARKFLMEHFEKEKDSRAIIFCEYRESVLLIHRLLLQNRPLIRPRIFVGQGGGGSIRAVTQKQQMKIMSDFREGVSNTLIATSVAEEGIDVGDVDLIICFDISTKNPTRLVQRIGRTGRKRQGHVIMLVTEGKEHSIVKEALATKDKTNQKITKSKEIQQILYPQSPRMIPLEFDPKCVQVYIQSSKQEESCEIANKTEGKGKKRQIKENSLKTKKSKGISSVDVRKFMKKIEKDNGDSNNLSISNSDNTRRSENTNFEEPNTTTEASANPVQEELFVEESRIAKHKDLQNLIRKINNSTRRLGKDLESEIINSLSEALKSTNLSKSAKRYYLEQNYDYVKDKFETLKAIEAVIDFEEGEEVGEVSNIKKEFSLIENIFDGRHEVIKFLENYKEKEITNDHAQNLIDQDKFADIFQGLEERGFCDNVEDFIEEKLKEINSEMSEHETLDKNKNKSLSSDVLPEKSLKKFEEIEDSFENEFDFVDSKYASQWTQFKNHEMKKQSTPLRKNEIHSFMNTKKFETTSTNMSKGEVYGEQLSLIESDVKKPEDDLFDDDFDELLATSTNALLELENEANKLQKENKDIENSKCKSKIQDSFSGNEKILDGCLENVSSRKIFKQELKDVDLNEFFEPFDEKELMNDHKYFPNKTDSRRSNSSIFSNVDDSIKSNEKTLRNSTQFQLEKSRTSVEQKDSSNVLQEISNIESQECSENDVMNTSDKILGNFSPKKLSPIKSTNTSPSIFERKINFSKLKCLNKTVLKITENENDQEVTTPKLNSIENFEIEKSVNDSLGSVNKIDENTIGKALKRNNKRVIESSESSLGSDDELTINNKKSYQKIHKKQRKAKRRRCSFIDDHAEVSGKESENDDFNETSSQYALNSLIADDCEEHALTINMKAKYLQSVKSPARRFGAFKIPSNRQYLNLSQICSQSIVEEELDTYKEDSFVISDDDNDICNDEVNETCPLERAEAILEAERKNRRKNIPPNNKRRKRIIVMEQESGDEDS